MVSLRGQAIDALRPPVDRLVRLCDEMMKEVEWISLPIRPVHLLRHPLKTIRLKWKIDLWSGQLEDIRDTFRTATVVLMDAQNAAGLRFETLLRLFEEGRNSPEQIVADLNVLRGFYMPLGQLLRDKLDSLPSKTTPPLPAESREEIAAAPKQYERDAYLSFVSAIQENSHLAQRPLREVYDWIKENGIEIDGVPYVLPNYDTWQKYRRTGERHASGGNP